VPSGLADTITEAQFSAIDSDGNGKISKSELTTAKTEYEQNGAVNGVMITLKDITTIEVYYGYDLGDDDSEDPQFDDGGSGLQTSEVRLDGSTIRISSEGLTSFSIADLPNNVRVSNVGDGVYDPNAGEILVGGPTNPAPDTYEFTLNPDTDEYAVGDTVEFTVQGNAVTIPVVQAASIPSGLADKGVSSDSYNAVVGTDEKLGAGNLASAIQSWSGDDGSTTGSVGETNVGAGELSSMIRYWSNQIGG
jgi:hypothetical protein